MNTFSPGLSDSIASVLADPPPCPHCASSSHIAGGLCVGCLLEAGLEPADENESETLTDVLSEVRLPDQNWRLGNYEILEEIGRGGMGVIYRARQRHSRRIVAVKRVLSYHSDSRETLARFRREAQAAASLDHPNILPIYEVSESDDGLPYFSMKFAPGGTLQQVAPALRQDTRQCVALVAKVARAVQYAHSRGILHRDLKPGNILLDGRGEPLVSDFGLAKWLDTASDLTRTLTIFGTPGYIAPEQASASAADLKPTADVYSLGAILFDLLAGRPPFLGAHALSVIRQAAESPAPKLRSLTKLADRDLETICSRCLEREPSARYRSAHDLATDLERWLEGRPILARPVTALTKTWRWSKRNRLLATSIVASVVFGCAGGGWVIQNRHLAAEVREKELIRRSLVVVPFLNLDTGTADSELSRSVAIEIARRANELGPCNIKSAERIPDKWTGIGTDEEVRTAARDFRIAAVLAGTIRTIGTRKRVSLQMVRQGGSEVTGYWQLDLDQAVDVARKVAEQRIARHVFEALDGQGGGRQYVDAAMTNETARNYIQVGRDLLDRRTIAEVERAIACFDGAIRATPTSAHAHAYLALAYMGRNFLTYDRSYIERAFAAARRALELSPADAIANRSLAALYISTGEYAKALEYGFRSLEAAQPTERAFGQIAFTLKMMGRPDKAIAWFRKANVTQRLPADYEALIGDCWADLQDRAKAQAAYEAAARFRPDLPEGWLGLCRLELLEGRFEAARRIYAERAAEYGHFNNAKQLQAQIEFYARNFSLAEQMYTELHAANPQNNAAQQYGLLSYQSVLACLKGTRNDPGAIPLLSECRAADEADLAKTPHHPEVLYRLAATRAIAGENASAVEALRAAIEAGWSDARSPELDPRFDMVRDEPEFRTLLAKLQKRLVDLRQEMREP